MVMEEQESKQVYYNRPQIVSLLVDANEEYDVWGRGTGKSSGVLAPRTRRNVINMPRSCGAMVAETYQQTLTRTLPSMINGWEKLGLIKDIHYVIGQRPDKKWNWPVPFEPPQSYKYFIQFCNGAGIHLVSQDINGSGNGLNTDWIAGDEAKYLNYDKFLDELLPTMRANRTLFGHLYYHHSIAFTTSMPTAVDAKWILKKEEDMDAELVELIVRLAIQRNELQKDFSTAAKSYKKGILRKIKQIEAQLNTLRKTCVYYSEANTLDNIHVLGEEYISKMRRIMPDFIFDTEIMNKRPDAIEGGFYPMLDLGKHTYANAYNNTYLEGLNYDMQKLGEVDCRMDSDLIADKPLWIGVDWGDRINCMTIAQDIPHELRFINTLHVLRPQYLDHLAAKFCEYYRHHKSKVVYYTYGHDGARGMANSAQTYAEQFAAILKKHGWTVHMRGKKSAPGHSVKYLLIAKVLDCKEHNIKPVMINRANCKELLVSMLHAPARQGRKGIEKDKRSEGKENIPAEDATHYSDTFDLIIDALYSSVMHERPDYIDTVVGN